VERPGERDAVVADGALHDCGRSGSRDAEDEQGDQALTHTRPHLASFGTIAAGP
jgi:hypothetical protein